MQLILNLPCNSVTPPTFNSIIKLINYTNKYKDFDLVINQCGGSHVGFTREKCMGWDDIRHLGTKDRVLFNGKWPDYDAILWVDSDIQFEPEDFLTLWDDQQDIVCGYYKMADARNLCCVMEVPNGRKEEEMSFMSVEEIQKHDTLIELNHGGLGFCLVRKGVFESIDPPFFMDQKIERGGRVAYVGEDVAFFHKAREAGHHVYCDPRVKVGHYKNFII